MAKSVGHKPKSKLPVNKLPTGLRSAPESTAIAYKPSKQELDERRRYHAEDALRDIERAERHKRDKGLMGDVKQLANERIECLKKV